MIKHDRDPDDYSTAYHPGKPAEKLNLLEIERLCQLSLKHAQARRLPPKPLRRRVAAHASGTRYWIRDHEDVIGFIVAVLVIIAIAIAILFVS